MNDNFDHNSNPELTPFNMIIGNDYNYPQSNLSFQERSTIAASDQVPHTLDTTDKNSLIKALENDPSLRDLWDKAKGTDSEYTVNDRVLYRLTTNRNKEPYTQIFVPTDCRENIIRIAHSTIIVGHSGYKKRNIV